MVAMGREYLRGNSALQRAKDVFYENPAIIPEEWGRELLPWRLTLSAPVRDKRHLQILKEHDRFGRTWAEMEGIEYESYILGKNYCINFLF